MVERKEGWKNGEVGERRKRVGERWGGMRETGDKGKKGEKGERSRGREKGEEEWEKTTPCPPPHRFSDSFCLFGITNAHYTPVI